MTRITSFADRRQGWGFAAPDRCTEPSTFVRRGPPSKQCENSLAHRLGSQPPSSDLSADPTSPSLKLLGKHRRRCLRSLCASIGRCCLSPDCRQRVQQGRHTILLPLRVHRNEGRKAKHRCRSASDHGFQVGTEALRSPRNAVEIALNLEQWNEFDVHRAPAGTDSTCRGRDNPDIHRIRDRPTSQSSGTGVLGFTAEFSCSRCNGRFALARGLGFGPLSISASTPAATGRIWQPTQR